MKKIELKNIEISEYCMLNIKTGSKKIYKNKKKFPYFTGFYFSDENTFFGFYPFKDKLIMYFEGVEYPLHKDLHINLEINEPWRKFSIDEYDIQITYHTSKYLGFDSWSENEDVDLFYLINKYYKDDEFYKKYTSDN